MIANKKSLLALSVASALMLSGCFSDDDNNVTVTPPPPEPTDPVVVAPEKPEAISFLVSAAVVASDDYGSGDDAIEAGDAINATVHFFENGEASTNILNEDGEAVTSIETGEEGSFAFRLKDDADIDSVTVAVMADGYFSKSFNVDFSLAGDESVLNVQLPLVSKLVDDVAEASETVAAADGTTTEAVAASANADDTALATATLAAGTTLKDADGEIVAGDNLQLNVTGAKAGSRNAISIVPEGLNSGDSQTVKSPVSVSDVTLTLGERKVKQFEGGTLNVAMAAPEGTTSADDLTVSSYDEDKATWTDEDFDVSFTDGKLTFDTDHLTFFAINKQSAVCTDGMTIDASGGDTTNGPLFVSMFTNDFAFFGMPLTVFEQGLPAGLISRFGVSDSAEARVFVTDVEGSVWFDSSTVDSANTLGEIGVCGSIDTPLTAPYTSIDKTLELTGVCAADNDVEVDVTASKIKFKRTGTRKAARNKLAESDGTFLMDNIRDGSDYTVTVNFRGLQLADGQSNVIELTDVDSETYSQQFQFQCDTTTGSTGTTGGS
ncbi:MULTISPECIES: hypothetical protein [unclassified Pseudoalteromonas]|uniref:hypothetical protein n=1 Tax=unclassified Pseudoalteromonas TaxID=194690 RepID=UPI0030146815